MQPSDFKPETPADTYRLRTLLEGMALPKDKVTGPMMVQYGTEDMLVNEPWTRSALTRACALGSYIDIEKRVGEGHGDLDSARAFPWLKARLTGQQSLNSCPGGT